MKACHVRLAPGPHRGPPLPRSTGTARPTVGGTATRNGNGPNEGRTTRKGSNGKPNGTWPISLVLAAEVELAIEGEDTTVDGFAVCTRCAAVLPGSEISRALHARFHELVDGIDQRVG